MNKQKEKYDIQTLYLGTLIVIDEIKYFGFENTRFWYRALKDSIFQKTEEFYYGEYLDLCTGMVYKSSEKFLEVGDVVFHSKSKISLEAHFLKNNISYKKYMTLDEIMFAFGFVKRETQHEEAKENNKNSFSKYARKRK